jgi:beta-xylosidase
MEIRSAILFKTGLLLLLLGLVSAACAAGQGQPPSPTLTPTASGPVFTNPVFLQNFPDPHLILAGDTWYAFATNGSSRNVQVATSTNLVNWKMERDGMPALAPWVRLNNSDVWAPEVMEIDGQYRLYYTARDRASGRQCVGVASSDTPGGRFRDTSDAPLVCQTAEGGSIDAHPYRDGERLFLFFKNDGNCCGIPTYIYVQEMASDGLSLLGEPVRLIRNDQPWEGIVIEAPTMVEREGQYYLFYSANNYAGFEYAVGYARCESVTGPCVKAPENPILSSRMDVQPLVVGPGHQTIITVNGQDWLVYHAWEILPSGVRGDRRTMWLDRLEWNDGTPSVVGPTSDPQPVP